MEQYTKDEINFNGFLTAYRLLQGVEMQDLTKGIYSKSFMSRVESGERLPKKLERDRLVARLGVSGEGYEDYLSMEEHEEWKLRQEILKSIEEKNIEKLEEQLKKYESTEEMDNVEKQFLEAMRFMLLKLKGAPEEELRRTIELAVSYTIADISDGFPEKLILADQEINLLIEYVNLRKVSENEDECHKWRIARYKDIMAYIEQSYMDDIGKVKVVPKLVYYVGREHLVADSSLEDLQKCLDLCRSGIDLIRDTRKIYYFVELLDMFQWNAEYILNSSHVFSDEYRNSLREDADIANRWAQMFIDLYEEYNVPPYMENFVHLYVETECHCINDVIRIRRKMMKMTQKALAGEIFDEKTVRRTEKKEMSPQMYTVRGLFKKLGLCPEYVRGSVITHDAEAMKLHLEVMRYDNERRFREWRESLEALERKLNMDIVQNRQAIMRERTMLDYETGRIEAEEVIEKLMEALELTISVEKSFKAKEWYWTIEEATLLYDLSVFHKSKTKHKYKQLLKEYFEKDILKTGNVNRPDTYEMIFTGIANHLGDLGKYELSNQISSDVIRNCLKKRRLRNIARNVYIKCWNKYNINASNCLRIETQEAVSLVKCCIELSKIMRHKKLEEFFVAKLKD